MPSRKKAVTVLIVFIFVIFVFLPIAYVFTVSPPADFKEGEIFSVEEGETLSEISDALISEGYVRSAVAFKVIVRGFFFTDTGAVAGDYFFEKPLNAITLAKRIVSGDFDLLPVKITIPEGLNKFEIADLIKKQLPDFDSQTFLALASEGYLFPDTYFFAPKIQPKKVVETMRENFNRQIELYRAEIEALRRKDRGARSLDELIKMASILETEARQSQTRQTIAGILWKRIDIGMPLQVDVSFKYINGKGTHELTGEDLEIDSPYNSYKYTGLPPTPIANPGLDSIFAAISPIESPYFYFLSDKNGVMHYAVTFEEHKKNKLLYLR